MRVDEVLETVNLHACLFDRSNCGGIDQRPAHDVARWVSKVGEAQFFVCKEVVSEWRSQGEYQLTCSNLPLAIREALHMASFAFPAGTVRLLTVLVNITASTTSDSPGTLEPLLDV